MMIIKPDADRIILQPVQVAFLEMHTRPAEAIDKREGVFFELIPNPVDLETYREYYYGVGEKYYWLDRMVMDDEELFQKINAVNVHIYVMHINNEPGGYAEFLQEKDYTEIVYFGLLPSFIGKGLGKYFLQWVIQKAWSYQPLWIQLNTCVLDHPNALPSYKNAGFKEVKSEIQQRRILK